MLIDGKCGRIAFCKQVIGSCSDLEVVTKAQKTRLKAFDQTKMLETASLV